jgi:hypothetical protein
MLIIMLRTSGVALPGSDELCTVRTWSVTQMYSLYVRVCTRIGFGLRRRTALERHIATVPFPWLSIGTELDTKWITLGALDPVCSSCVVS